jgi:GNAT superfamily N-acetyltransferase
MSSGGHPNTTSARASTRGPHPRPIACAFRPEARSGATGGSHHGPAKTPEREGIAGEQTDSPASTTAGDAISYRYPSELDCDLTTAFGTGVHVRPIRPNDASRLSAFHLKLSSRSVYRRFFSLHPSLSEAEVRRFTCVDYVDRLALIAEVGEQMVAVGRYDHLLGTPEAEVAFVVADEFQHHGIATLLLELLAQAAWRSGITTFVASTLAENREMLGVFMGSGFEVSTSVSFGVVEVRFLIDSSHRHRAPADERPEGLDRGSKRSLPPTC